MALPSSGAISMAQIQAEFGGANPISLSEYYKGGAYVKTTDYAPSVPTSGAISMSNFYGAYKASAVTASLSATAADGSAARGAGSFTCTPSITVTASGGIPGYTYLWEKVSGDTFTMSGSTTATVTFTHSKTVVGMWTGIYRCKVTDSYGGVGYSGNVTVTGDVY